MTNNKYTTAFSEAHEWKDDLLGLTFPSIMMFYGVPKSGKTHLLLQILTSIKHKFDEIIVYLGCKDACNTFLQMIGKKDKTVMKILFTYCQSCQYYLY